MDQITCLDDFYRMVEKILNLAWGGNWGSFRSSFPTDSDPNSIITPLITYKLKSKRPAIVGSKQELKPRIREQYSDPNDKRNGRTVLGQRFDCSIIFNVWEQNEKQATLLADRFEELMLTYSGIFKEMGLIELVFVETSDNKSPASWRVNLNSKTIEYHVVIEKITHISTEMLENVRIKLLEEKLQDSISQPNI